MHSALLRALIFALVITTTGCLGLSQEPAHQAATESSLPDAPQSSQKMMSAPWLYSVTSRRFSRKVLRSHSPENERWSNIANPRAA